MHSIQLNQALPSDHELTQALIRGFGTFFQTSERLDEVSNQTQPSCLPQVIYLRGPQDV